MKISERIQQLRKAQGISQEELAAQLGVSRQAVSKWESGQTLPDLEKVESLCQCLDTTADYLIRGMEPAPGQGRNALPFSIAATAVNAVGLIAAVSVWNARQEGYAIGIGLGIMAVGTMLFFMGQALGERNRERARRIFCLVNVWILSLIPFSLAFSLLDGLLGRFFPILAPIPHLENSPLIYGLCWLSWLGCCAGTDLLILRRKLL